MKLASQDAVVALDEDFGKMAVQAGRHAWGLPELTMREKAFVFVAADMCHHNLQFPLQAHVTMAVSNGVELAGIREAVRHLAPYVGYPTAAETLMRLAEIESSLPDPAAATGQAVAGARAAAPGPAEPPVLDTTGVRGLDGAFADFLAQQFEERWGRSGLSPRERALCTIATDVMNGTLDESFRLHVGLALASGAGEQQVRAVLLLLAEFGVAKSWRAYRALAGMAAARS
ncbi:MAG TPA: carboxymuconolactone decarboxylase family protein [Micromonosporaceae bacterium]|nr:carboxymuconolactone decarboxylase family protein [Micromonosporaceae bacterium]